MYVKKSVPRDTKRSNPGAVTAKQQEITIYDTNDILGDIERDSKGVLVTENIVMKAGKFPIKLYLTPSTQEPSFASEGDENAESFTHKVMGMHPGTSLEAMEFTQNWLGRPVIAIWSGCDGNQGKQMYGTKCAPLKLKAEYVANNDKTGFTFTFESIQKTSSVPATYLGAISYDENFTAADFNLEVTTANGNTQQLPSSAIGDAIDIATIDLEHGEVVSLVGGGGSTPATLSTGVATAATVLLKDGTQWTALNNAIINLQVFDDGTTKYLREVSRA